MPTVYLLRHAESRHNVSVRTYSNSDFREVDVDLSAHGERQARNVTGEYDLVLCSPLKRTRRTLELSKIKYKELKIVPEARELVGSQCDCLEGENFITPESHIQMKERMVRLKQRISEEAESGKKILLVSHYFTIEYLTSTDSGGGISSRNGQSYKVEL